MGGKGSGGSNRKDPEIKLAQGNRGKRTRKKDAEIVQKVSGGNLLKPDWLNAEASAEWDRLLPILKEIGNIGPEHASPLASLCVVTARWKQAEREIDLFGITIREIQNEDDDDGAAKIFVERKKNPAVAIASDALRHKKALELQFGLTPASRLGVKNAKPGKPDDGRPMSFLAAIRQAKGGKEVIH